MADITLTSASRNNLMALQNTADMVKRTQSRLSTGKSVNSVVDDALKFFSAKSLSDRATDLTARKDSIDQGVSALKATVAATDKIESFLGQMKGLVNASRSADKATRAENGKQIAELAKQIEKLVQDTSYQGQNLLNSTAAKLTVTFSDKTDSKLTVQGVDFKASVGLYRASGGNSALGVTANAAAGSSVKSKFLVALGLMKASVGAPGLSAVTLSVATDQADFNAKADAAIAKLDQTISNVRAKASVFGNSVAVLQVRLDFTKTYSNVLSEGSDKLTLADLNEEGANLLALQTRQQLGIQSLSFAGQQEQGILGLFR
ncbi:flagellin N-terminal helical domain-containing protein [Novispirillum itersonii]|uniref:flagellin N-terminal helical domain-containing protein n=1 Tax=Novispirillum itersonii TaxID=189 RepID=UPI0003745C64|nr:flagellin [Novispirillum itersonii]